MRDVKYFVTSAVRATIRLFGDSATFVVLSPFAEAEKVLHSTTVPKLLVNTVLQRFSDTFICPYNVEHPFALFTSYPRCPCSLILAAIVHSHYLEPSFTMLSTFCASALTFVASPDTIFSTTIPTCPANALLRAIICAWAEDGFTTRLECAIADYHQDSGSTSLIPDLLLKLHVASITPDLVAKSKAWAVESARTMLTNLISNNAASFRSTRAAWIVPYLEGPLVPPPDSLLTPEEHDQEAKDLSDTMSVPP